MPVLLANGARAERVIHLPQGVPDGFAGGPRCTPSPDEFVVGYGLDYDSYYRELPCIAKVTFT